MFSAGAEAGASSLPACSPGVEFCHSQGRPALGAQPSILPAPASPAAQLACKVL